MSMLAVGLILLSAVLHATWNLLAKRAQGGASFTWLYDLFALVIFAPFVCLFVLLTHTGLSLQGVGFIIVSGFLELAYFLVLQRGYRAGDLSLVYPVARGTGPLLATIAAILLLHEHPTPLTLFGTVAIVSGVIIIAIKPGRQNDRSTRIAILYGILTGGCIASYTLWDKEALSLGQLAPLILYYGTICLRVPVLTPYALKHWQEISFHWHHHKLEALGIAVLGTLAYIMVLTALTFTPVSSLAPFREISVLFGIVLGTHLLAESDTKRRLLAAGIMVTGIIALAI